VRPHLATLVDDFRRHGGQRAVVLHRGTRQYACSYGELAHLAERFASTLIERNVAVGECVVLWGRNSAEWIAAFFGCVLRGVLVVPLDAAGDVDFARRVIAETRPRLIAADRSLLLQLESAVPRLALEDLAETLPLVSSPANLQEPSLGLDTPLQILFTSGTTSEPKGIVHTHRNVLASLDPIECEMQKYLPYERIFHPLRFLHTLPLSHVFGQFMGLWVPPLMAAEVHFENRLQPRRLVQTIRTERISVLAAVPRVLDLLQTHLEAQFPGLGQRLEALHGKRVWTRWWRLRDVHRAFGFKFWALVCGGAALPAGLESFWSELGFALIQGYGMTETAALITLNHPFHIGRGTLGKPLPGRELRIGPDGEILVRGEMVSQARWQDGRMQVAGDDWLATGDLAEQDAEGQLRFRGRKSEIIVTAAGLNIHPEDVEAALNRQPGVTASAVVPMESSAGSEAVAVLLFRGSHEQAQRAVDGANLELADYQRVRRWKLWPQLDFPRSGIGKIQRRKVTEWLATQAAGGASAAAESDPLSNMIARITRSQPRMLRNELRLDRDLNLDSLARVQLQTELDERLGVSITDEELSRLLTVGDLRNRIGLDRAERITPAEVSQNTPQLSQPEPEMVYPKWTWTAPAQFLRVFFQEAIMRPLVWLLAAPRVTRLPGFVPPEKPLLIVANHVTAFDAPLVLFALPAPMRRRVAIAMRGEMLEDFRHGRRQGSPLRNLLAPAAYWLITLLFNVFPLPNHGFRRSFAHAGEAMDHNYHVLIFPEGRRTRDGKLQPFRSGIGLLASESAASVLPVAIRGLGELKVSGENWFRSGKLEIVVGPAVSYKAQAPEQLAEALHKSMSDLL
jgi:long-chain acyl-CoA synthetase